MKKYFYGIIFFIGIVLIYLISKFEIRSIDCCYIKTFWHNVQFISKALYVIIPLLIMVLVFLFLLTDKWAMRVEKLSIGGFNVIFDSPKNLYRRQVRNYLDTKRTIFVLDCKYDNFKETFDSYYNIYTFFREQAKFFGNVKERKFRNNDEKRLYELTNEIIRVLNNFLTKYQSNYRRWYTYLEKKDEEKFYLTPIGDLQKEYMDYDDLCKAFKEVNKYFVDNIASEFEIDINKWTSEVQ